VRYTLSLKTRLPRDPVECSATGFPFPLGTIYAGRGLPLLAEPMPPDEGVCPCPLSHHTSIGAHLARFQSPATGE